MAPRFDRERSTLHLSVADLIDATLARSLGFSQRGGYERMWMGQAIHSRYQEEQRSGDGSYRSEVSLKVSFPHKGWQVTVIGRADGLRQQDGETQIEEIKSVRRGTQLPPATLEMYSKQAALYAWMAHRSGIAPISADLVLIEIGSDHVERQPVEIHLPALEAGVRRRVGRLIADYEREATALHERHAAAGRLSFPYPELRPGQTELIAAVEVALEQREHLLLEAPTGIGKTVSALYPALKYALAHDKRVFVLTAKTLQQEMAGKVLNLLNRERAFHSVRLKAKSKMCANDEILCHEEYCPYAREYYQKLQSTRLLDHLRADQANIEPQQVFDAARAAEVCPFEVNLELCRKAQVVVCDYNYAFDPYVGLSDFGPDEDLGDTVLVIDEIHNLVHRGRSYYSPSLAAEQALAAAVSLEARGDLRVDPQRRLCLKLADMIEGIVQGVFEDSRSDLREAEAELPEEDLLALRLEFDQAFVDYLEFQRDTKGFQPDDRFTMLYFDLLRFLNGVLLASTHRQEFSRSVERHGKRHRISILCKDPSRFLGSLINRTHATVGLSATLSPVEFYRDLLGFDSERTCSLRVPTPFPLENRRIVIDNTVATTWKERESNYQPIAARLSEFAAAVPGNCLALFPSYRFLEEVAHYLEPSGKRVLVQSRGDSDSEREEILATLRNALFGDVLLLAVAGGVFAEGVDYPGDTLRAVAVVGPCLPAVTLEQNLLKRYYDERFDRGFEYAYVVPGMTRVVQAAGRLIRSPDDSGVIALLDKRFLYTPYKQHIAEDWLPAEGIEALIADPGRVAREFFSSLASDEPSPTDNVAGSG